MITRRIISSPVLHRIVSNPNTTFRCSYCNTTKVKTLKERLVELIPSKRADLEPFKKKYGSRSLGKMTIHQMYDGMHGVPAIISEGSSVLDPQGGIQFHGLSLSECKSQWIAARPNSKQPLPEAMFWYLVTGGEIPTSDQISHLSHEWHRRSCIPSFVIELLAAFSKTLHPPTQFALVINALQHDSRFAKFAKAYQAGGLNRDKYWDTTFEDCMDLIAKLPTVATYTYQNVSNSAEKKDVIKAEATDKDYAFNFVKMWGHSENNGLVANKMRLYLTVNADHGGSHVSAHIAHLVGSALSDPYLSFAADLNALSGSLSCTDGSQHGVLNVNIMDTIDPKQQYQDFQKVLFGVSRALDASVQSIWDRVFFMPIESPKSYDIIILKKSAEWHAKRSCVLRRSF